MNRRRESAHSRKINVKHLNTGATPWTELFSRISFFFDCIMSWLKLEGLSETRWRYVYTAGECFYCMTIYNWDLILSVVLIYFSGVYGEKFCLKYKYKLKSNLDTDENKILLVKLVYSLTSALPPDKLSLQDKLKSLSLVDLNKLVISYPESTLVFLAPSFWFCFLLGDGSIYIRIRMAKSGSPSFIPNIIIYQKADANATLVLALLSKYLNSIGVKSTVITPNKAGQTSLRIEL